MFFANEQRENVREENPGISFGQVGKLLGERWKALDDKQRTPYEAKAAADKKRYEDEKAAYNVSYQCLSLLIIGANTIEGLKSHPVDACQTLRRQHKLVSMVSSLRCHCRLRSLLSSICFGQGGVV